MKPKALSAVMLISVMLLLGCSKPQTTQPAPTTDAHLGIPIKEHLVLAVLWQQHAAEYRALCYQAYNVAKQRIDWVLANHDSDLPLAIIADIDETVLDNSPYSSRMILDDINYSRPTWYEWGRKESAKPVPGALDFYRYVADQGITVFYVSNRYQEQLTETINNLQHHGFPFAQAAHVLLKTETSGKEPRRQQILTEHEVVMLIGDNLSDFHQDFDDRSSAERNHTAKKMQQQFGSRYIVLPNPMYGDWETDGLYEGRYDWSEAEKAAMRRSKLLPD
ncbi:5'-nucleotidase, lipoprotein e(P4) family [Marinicella meishanensis]|uniref:5'-nucleotidase, lipoprotein e(P4) family n=1 Tax=Marinicella meishanensis TaxID=2873263 RepID=UPI001CBB20C8|nr:5'-nucleotidase, lipoprotein e(P4) family [Marinicella sp. NBU2979]